MLNNFGFQVYRSLIVDLYLRLDAAVRDPEQRHFGGVAGSQASPPKEQ